MFGLGLWLYNLSQPYSISYPIFTDIQICIKVYLCIFISDSRWVEREIDIFQIRAKIFVSNYFRAGGKTDNKA